MAIIFPFEFQELENSPEESLDRESGVNATRAFRVPWENRWDFALGMTNAYYPGFTAVLAQRIRISPYVAKPTEQTLANILTDINTHEFARVTVEYASAKNGGTREEQPDGTFLSYRQGTTVEFQTVPSRALVWDSDDEVVSPDAYATFPISVTDHVITWSEVSNPPWSFISEAKGKVNASAYDIPVIGLNVAAEQLLFESAESSAKIDATGNAIWELTYTLKERSAKNYGGADVGWNHQFRDDPAGWVKVKDASSGEYTFSAADLSQVFVQS